MANADDQNALLYQVKQLAGEEMAPDLGDYEYIFRCFGSSWDQHMAGRGELLKSLADRRML